MREKKIKIANAFSRRLLEDLGQEDLDEAVRLNKGEEDDWVCHTHDFCDANMPFMDAFEEVMGREYPTYGRITSVERELIADSWKMAKENEFKQIKL